MYLFPSISQAKGPLTLSKTIGWPPTDLKALTGELTPPGISSWAAEKTSPDLV
jgi:hypothetical protein